MNSEPRWRAKWIALPRGDEHDAGPAIHFRKTFQVDDVPVRAELQITACGVFEAWINGERVGRDVLTPGWSDYRKRSDFLRYDVAVHLCTGENTIEVLLAEGWYSAYLSEPQFHIRYGTDPLLLAQIVHTDGKGRERLIGTDATWTTGLGPITSASLYHGESFDARKRVEYGRLAQVRSLPRVELSEKICPPVRAMAEIIPVAITQSAKECWIFDLGENIAGWARLQVRAPRGTKLSIRYGEMLEVDGSLYTANLRSARCTDTYTCKGGATESWEPRFTFHGFRYVEVTGLPRKPTLQTITGIVLHSALADAGTFICSDPLLNKLQQCIVRSQKGNFVDLPTDCPQRDERLGWSGDAQIFCRTALYNQHGAPLFRQWMRAMRDGQRKDGAFPDIAPHIILDHGSAGWSDAGIIVPWTVWQMTGDPTIIEENYEAMGRHVAWLEKTNPDGIRRDQMFGDWLAVDAKCPQHVPTPKDLIGTAYFARITRELAEMAKAIGRKQDAAKYVALTKRVRAAFAREFVTRTGRVVGDTQTAYLMALGFDLVPKLLRTFAIQRLVELMRTRDWHLATGFLGTSLICPVLAECGEFDAAWRVLTQRSYPGWLYPVLNGATTMWERWDSWTKERGFGDVGMNSFNHYAYGAVGEFLYAKIAGLDQAKGSQGFRQLRVAPQPGELTFARATHVTPFGEAMVSWKRTDTSFELDAVIPEGCTAKIALPDSPKMRLVKSGTHHFASKLR